METPPPPSAGSEPTTCERPTAGCRGSTTRRSAACRSLPASARSTLVNSLPGERVVEVGVGTGLSLPLYAPSSKRVTGIDLSTDMLERARRRTAEEGLSHVEALLEVDAERTGLPDAEFDVAVAMFVASVVPHPDLLLAEMKRIVRPGGWLIFVNHFSAERGPRLWAEKALSPLASPRSGLAPGFRRSPTLLRPSRPRARRAVLETVPPLRPVHPGSIDQRAGLESIGVVQASYPRMVRCGTPALS